MTYVARPEEILLVYASNPSVCVLSVVAASANVWVARQPPGFAFVEFEDPRDGEDAIREMNNKELFGCVLRVEESKGRRGKGGKGGDDGMKPGDWYAHMKKRA